VSLVASILFLELYVGILLAEIIRILKRKTISFSIALASCYGITDQRGDTYLAFQLTRRLVLGAAIVFIHESSLQALSISLISFLSAVYILGEQPFPSMGENILETANEIIILLASYHLLLFQQPSIH